MTGRTMSVALSVAALAASFTTISPAAAAGCNGVVSQAEWGCAFWDNNNGPQFPHYRRAGAAAPAPAARVLTGRTPGGIATNNGANVISNDGASVVSHDGASARSRGNRN